MAGNPGEAIVKDILNGSVLPEESVLGHIGPFDDSVRFDRLAKRPTHMLLNGACEDDLENPGVPDYCFKIVKTHHEYLDHVQKLAKKEFSPGSTIVWFGTAKTYEGEEFRCMYEDKRYWDWISKRDPTKIYDWSNRVLQIEKEWKAYNLKYPEEEEKLRKSMYLDATIDPKGPRWRKSTPRQKEAYLYYIDDETHAELHRAGFFNVGAPPPQEENIQAEHIAPARVKVEIIILDSDDDSDDDSDVKPTHEIPIRISVEQAPRWRRSLELTPEPELKSRVKVELAFLSQATLSQTLSQATLSPSTLSPTTLSPKTLSPSTPPRASGSGQKTKRLLMTPPTTKQPITRFQEAGPSSRVHWEDDTPTKKKPRRV